METPSSTALLLHGFDAWVKARQPQCKEASVVLRCLHRALRQASGAKGDMVFSIARLNQERYYAVQVDDMALDFYNSV